MSRDEVRAIVAECLDQAQLLREREVRALVKEAVCQTLESMGIDRRDPVEVQRDMAWLRDVRKASAAARSKAGLTLLGLLVSAVVGAVWLGTRAFLRGE